MMSDKPIEKEEQQTDQQEIQVDDGPERAAQVAQSKNLMQRTYGFFLGWLQPKRWSNFDQVKRDGYMIGGLFQKLFRMRSMRSGVSYDDFASFIEAHQLDEQKIKRGQVSRLFWSIICVISAICLAGYAIVLFSSGMIMSGLLVLIMTVYYSLQGVLFIINHLQFKHRVVRVYWKDIFRLLGTKSEY